MPEKRKLKLKRRTFGESVAYILDTYGGTGRLIFEESKNSALMSERWKKLQTDHPDLANLIQERIFIDQINPEKIDAMMREVSVFAELEIKRLWVDMIEPVFEKLEWGWRHVDETPHPIEIYLMIKSWMPVFSSVSQPSDVYNAIENAFIKDTDSLEYLLALLDYLAIINYPDYHKNFESKEAFYQSKHDFIKEIQRVLLESDTRYKFLLHSLSHLIIYDFYYRSNIAEMPEQERFTLAESILSDDPPTDLFFLANRETVLEYELDIYVLILINSIFSPQIENFHDYKTFITRLLEHPFLDLTRFCNTKDMPNKKHPLGSFYEDRRGTFQQMLAIVWIAYWRVVLDVRYGEELKKALALKIYQIKFLMKLVIIDDLPDTCPEAVMYLLETITLLRVYTPDSNIIISHYTTAESAYQMLCNKDKTYFRLMSTFGVNDAYEGKVFPQYLEDINILIYDNELAFIGCFTFLENDYNQFRLYGKSSKNGSEVGGVALEMHSSFFSNDVDIRQSMVDRGNPDPHGTTGRALYRCVYMNKDKPTTITAIAGLDDGEHYQKNKVFKERIEKLLKSIKKTYDKNANEKRKAVNEQRDEHLKQLSKFQEYFTLIQVSDKNFNDNAHKDIMNQIQNLFKEINDNTIQELAIIEETDYLQQLAHLIKNDDYVAENECRIIIITPMLSMVTKKYDIINDRYTVNFGIENREYNPLIKGIEGSGNLYIEDNRDMRKYIHKIILGEHFPQKELFLHKVKIRLDDPKEHFDCQKVNLCIQTRERKPIACIIKRKDL